MYQNNNNIDIEIKKIIDFIHENNILSARNILLELCFDTYYITVEQIEILTNLFEYICINNGDFLRAEQSLLEHLYLTPDSLDTNINMARVKAVRNTYFEACMYATKAVNLDTSNNTFNEMKELFEGTGYEEIFKYLSGTQKFHFVIAPTSRTVFFTSHKDSLIVWLSRMGHKVSVIHPKIKIMDLSNSSNKIQIHSNPLCLKSDSNILEYTIVVDNSMSKYKFNNLPMENILNSIFLENNLQRIFINRNINLQVNLSDEIPSIYWDFSCEGDSEKYTLENTIQSIKNIDEKYIDKLMCTYKPAVITTNNLKVNFYQSLVGDKVFLCNKYTRSSYEIIDFKLDFEQTIISDELFLNFILNVLEVANSLV